MKWTAFFLAGVWLACPCKAALFYQDFSGSSTLSDYVNSSSPNSGQWNAIGASSAETTVGINAGALEYNRNATGGAGVGSFTRNTPFDPIPTALAYRFDLKVSSITEAAPTAATWYVGSGFDAANGIPTISQTVNSRFVVAFNADGTYSLRVSGGATSASFNSGSTLSLTWIINATGAALSYQQPDGGTGSLGTGKWDLWAGTSLIFDDKSADNPTFALSELKFAFSAGKGTISMDNFSIEAVPEPAEWGTIIGIGLLGIGGLQRWRSRRAKAT